MSKKNEQVRILCRAWAPRHKTFRKKLGRENGRRAAFFVVGELLVAPGGLSALLFMETTALGRITRREIAIACVVCPAKSLSRAWQDTLAFTQRFCDPENQTQARGFSL